MLTTEELAGMAEATLKAAMVNDDDGVISAMRPLWKPFADAGDGFMFTVTMLHVVLDCLPQWTCPEHGKEPAGLSFRLDPEGVDLTPIQVAYRAMLVAEYRDDGAASLFAFHAAVMGGYGAELVYIAVMKASRTLRRHRASLQ